MSRSSQTPKSLSHPSYWTTWFGVALFWLLGQLPWRMLLGLGRAIGRLAWWLAPSRRRIVETNLALCFPEQSAHQRHGFAKTVMRSTGEAMTEIAGAYVSLHFNARERLEITGLEHLTRAQESGQGVLLLGMHFNTIDIGARLLGEGAGVRFSVVYRPNDNAVLDWLIKRGRSQYVDRYIDRADMRGLVRELRAGGICWYAPDQDYGTDNAVFAPFFGVPAATIATTGRIARMGKAVVVPCSHYRLPGGRYRICFDAPLDDFPTGDDLGDCTRVNQAIEHAVLRAPEQYLWVHRRFKHQPDGRQLYAARKRRR